MTDLHDLITRMADELDHYRRMLSDDRREVHALAAEARAATEHPLIGAYGWPLRTTDEQKRLGTVHILRVDRVIGHRVSGSTSCGHTFCMSIGTWKRDVDSATAQDWIRVGGDAADGPAVPEGSEPASVAEQPMSPPYWRGLCEELLRGLDENRHPEVRYPGHLRLVMSSARESLAQPEPEVAGPSDEELLATLNKATADFPPRHPEAEALNAVEYPWP